MSLPLITQPPKIGCGDPGDPIDFSCRFSGGQFLKRTFSGVPQNERKSVVVCVWVKRSDLSALNMLFSSLTGGDTYTIFGITGPSFDELLFDDNANSHHYAHTVAKGSLRDPATWMQVFIKADTTHVTAANRLEMVKNGRQQNLIAASGRGWGSGSGATNVYPPQDKVLNIGQSGDHYIGSYNNGNYNAKLRMAEFIVLFGPEAIAATPQDFGYFNSDGHWVPKKYTAGFGQNGFHLDFADPLDLGKDVSGNGKHFSSSGLTPDHQSTDTPTNNFWTINPLENSGFLSGNISEGNTKTQAYGGTSSFFHNLSYPIPKKGIWCWEQKIISGGSSFYPGYGIGTHDYKSVVRYRYSGSSTNLYINGTPTAYPAGNAAVGDVFGFQFDADNLVFKIFNNGVLESTHNVQSEDWCVAQNDRASSISQANFGDKPFEYPEVFNEDAQTLKIPNIDCPEILNPDDYFTIRQRANGDDVSDLPWNPQNVKTLVLSKCINASTNWRAVDTVNGAGKAWETNTPNAQIIENDGLTAFASNGYTVGSNLAYQGIRKDYIWRADPKAGFDIVQINHVNGSPSTVPHNCGGPVDYAWVVPHSGGNRRIYHKKLPSGKYAHLNVATTPATDNGWFSSTANDVTINGSLPSGVYTLYIWREVAQFSSFDGHDGNQSANGPFEQKDFTPRLLFCRKAAYGESNWMQEYEGVNPVTKMRYLNNTTGEYSHSSGYSIDFDSNGFKWRTADTSWNASGVEFITASWAQTPFKFARAQ